MRNLKKYLIYVGLGVIILTIESCVSFKSGYYEFNEKISSDNIDKLLNEAHKIETTASSADEVLKLIDAFKMIENADPYHYHALWKIGNYNILMGAAYSKNTKDKKFYYREAIKYCEKAMCTNQAFSSEVKKGTEITDACNKLTIDEIDAMGYWYTARFYYFKECMRPVGRIINTKIPIQNNIMIERIDELDPNWAGGGNYFSRALYYLSVPDKFGGSKQRAKEEFNKAVEVGPNYLVNRWGRAKYYYHLIGNIEAYKSELEWVVAQDPNEAANTYPWNVYFQKDAQKMLDNLK